MLSFFTVLHGCERNFSQLINSIEKCNEQQQLRYLKKTKTPILSKNNNKSNKMLSIPIIMRMPLR